MYRFPKTVLLSIFATGLAGAFTCSADAQVSRSAVLSIADAARYSAQRLDADKIGDAKQRQQAFLVAVDELKSHLTRTASASNTDAWIKYLRITDVLEGIEDKAKESVLAKSAAEVSQRATGLYPGLEVPAVVRVRQAASEYSDALRFSRKELIVKAISKQLQRYSEQLIELKEQPSQDDIATLGLLLDLLDRLDQQVPLTQTAMSRFSSPNLRVTIDDDIIQRSVGRNVNQSSPVRDCILGTRIVGDALLSGNVTATLLPSIGSVRVQIALAGNISSNNTGYNGPVRLRTSGFGQVHASRVVSVDESGVRLEPVTTTASLTTRIDAIEHRLRLVRRIAKKKAAEQKPAADKIARGLLISRVSERFSEDTAGAASRPVPDVMAQARPILRRLGFQEPTRTIGSTSNSVYLTATIRKDNQLASPVPPPPVRVGYEATLQIHESVINNTLGTLLAGRTMTQTELQRLAERSGRASSQAAATKQEDADESDEPSEFEIDFDQSRPIVFEARDGLVRIGIRGTRFKQGKRELKKQLEIAATYRPIKTVDGVVLLDRVGEAEIKFPGTKRLSTLQAGIRGSIKRGLADSFPQTLMDQPWKVPSSVEAPAIAGRTYRPRHFEAQNGWLTLGVGQ